MTYAETLAYIDTQIRQKTAAKSINPLDVATALESCAKLAYTAAPFPFFPTEDPFDPDIGVISSSDFIGFNITEIRGNGYILLQGIQFTKDPDEPNVVFLDGNSITPNNIVYLQLTEV